MASFANFVFFSTLDVIVVNMLLLKLYRLPFARFKLHIAGFSFVLALVSFMMRTQLNLTVFDLPFQYILFVLFYRFVLKYRFHYAAFIVGSGLSAYISIQMIVYFTLEIVGFADRSVIFEASGFEVNTIQVISMLIGALIAVFLKSTGRGFSFILIPPHDSYKVKYMEYKHLILLISSLISGVTISLTILIMVSQNYILMIILSLSTFVIAYYFSDRGDYESVRSSIEAYRKKTERK